MASGLDFVQYVCEQIGGAGTITYKKMFGEYGVWCSGKYIGSVCDNQFFVKKTAAGAAVCPDFEEAAPYEGASLHFLVDRVDDADLMTRFISATCRELPSPKPRKKKGVSPAEK